MLALHGMNDSRDAWEIPAPDFADAGIAVFAPDQRGFGATAARGFWPGAEALTDDARDDGAAAARRAIPARRLILLGESMGAAVLLHHGDKAGSAGGRRLRADRARGLGPRGNEPVPARRALAGIQHRAGAWSLTGRGPEDHGDRQRSTR